MTGWVPPSHCLQVARRQPGLPAQPPGQTGQSVPDDSVCTLLTPGIRLLISQAHDWEFIPSHPGHYFTSAGRTLGSDDPLGRHHFRPTLRSEKLGLWEVTCREHASSQVSPGQTGGRGFTVTLGPRGVFGRVGLPHPLPQPLSLCALGLQLLPPLGGGRVGLSQGARQLVVTVLQREELGLPLHLAHGAERARESAEGGAGPHWAGGGARAGSWAGSRDKGLRTARGVGVRVGPSVSAPRDTVRMASSINPWGVDRTGWRGGTRGFRISWGRCGRARVSPEEWMRQAESALEGASSGCLLSNPGLYWDPRRGSTVRFRHLNESQQFLRTSSRLPHLSSCHAPCTLRYPLTLRTASF